MTISYNKLGKLLIDRGISRTELKTAVRISPNTLVKLGRNETVSLDVLRRKAGQTGGAAAWSRRRRPGGGHGERPGGLRAPRST